MNGINKKTSTDINGQSLGLFHKTKENSQLFVKTVV